MVRRLRLDNFGGGVRGKLEGRRAEAKILMRARNSWKRFAKRTLSHDSIEAMLTTLLSHIGKGFILNTWLLCCWRRRR